MSNKAMLFVDGGWMYFNKKNILSFNDDFDSDIDYSRIPNLAQQFLEKHLSANTELVGVQYFASIPINKPNFNPSRQQAFYKYLKDDCLFDTYIFDIDHYNDPHFKCNNKSNEIALTSAAVTEAHKPNHFDIAIILTGDISFAPLMNNLQALGKKIMLISSNIAPECGQLQDFCNFDFPIVYLENYWDEIKLIREETLRPCSTCGNEEVTNWHGVEFYCKNCRTCATDLNIRECNNCGKQEETSWDEAYFYCFECRDSHRKKQAKIFSTHS